MTSTDLALAVLFITALLGALAITILLQVPLGSVLGLLFVIGCTAYALLALAGRIARHFEH
jgi:hypothetical protein